MYVIPSVVGNVNVGGATTPPTHTACVTAGATGVTAVHDAAAQRHRERRRRVVDPVHPAQHVPQPNPSANVAVTVTVVVRRPVTARPARPRR